MHYVIGDVHGCFKELKLLLNKIENKDPEAIIYFVGDWFEDEQPSDDIKKCVERKLAQNDWKIDVVLSHTLPFEYMPIDLFISGIDQSTVDNTTEHWLSDIEIKLDYKWWYAGHYHTSRITDKIQIMFEDIEEFGIHGDLYDDKRAF